MTTGSRRELTRQYKDNPPPMGVFRFRNLESGRTLLGTSANLPGMRNRILFQLEMGSHPDRELQADFGRLGAESFEFDVLDTLEQGPDAAVDCREDLAELLELWRAKLALGPELTYGGGSGRR